MNKSKLPSFECPVCYFSAPFEELQETTFQYTPAPGKPDTRGIYCPRCFQEWMFRNFQKMREKKEHDD